MISISTLLLCTMCLANLFSKVLAIKAIGVYSSLIVFSNAVIVLLLLPPMIFFNDKYLEPRNFYFGQKRGRNYNNQKV